MGDKHRITPHTPLGFLAGGGSMGAHIRGFDWSGTPLGPPGAWPSPLRTALRILLTTNHPVFVFWGEDGRCFYNDAYSRSLGPEKHPAILGQPARQAWAEIWDIIGPQFTLVMAGQGTTWHENHLVPITRHGQRQDVYWTYSYSPIDDPRAAAGVGGVLVLCTETTEQVLAQERLRAVHDRWRSYFEQAPGFMCILRGPGHVFEFANPAYFELVGHVDILGRGVAEALPWAAEQGFVSLLDQVYADGQAFIARGVEMVRPEAGAEPERVRHVDFVYQPIRDEHGSVTGIFVLGSDVSERKLAEQALRASEERLRIACQAAALGIHDYDAVSGVLRWDARVRELWGLAHDAAVNHAVFFAGLHPDDRAAASTAIEQALDPAGSGHYHSEFRVIGPADGATRWVQTSGRAAFAEGRALRLIGTAQDITEHKQVEARRQQFLATLSHELRNPLAPISNALQILKLRGKGSTDTITSQAHGVIERQLAQIVRLIDDLLDVVRLTHGSIRLRRETCTLEQVLQLALETAAPYTGPGEHQVVVQWPATPVRVEGDPARLAQVFANLLINACKYSDRGSPIQVNVERQGEGRVSVGVHDRGLGLSAAFLPRVFDMFSQAEPDAQRAQGGLGIGLSLAKGLVELHGGTVTAHSAGPGQGSSFVVQLPACPSTPAPASPAPQGGPADVLGGLRVLVVDDNADAAGMLAELLAMHGAQVATAFDGEHALRAYDQLQPQLVLLDIGLPLRNGYEVCRALREPPRHAAARIVALTGWGQDADRAHARDAGFDAHLVKPVQFDAVLALLDPAA